MKFAHHSVPNQDIRYDKMFSQACWWSILVLLMLVIMPLLEPATIMKIWKQLLRAKVDMRPLL
jgi:hypothetical protein